MPGTAIKRARKEAGILTPGEAYQKARGLLTNWLPECLETTMAVARGTYYERDVKGPDGVVTQRVYKREPNLIALTYLIDHTIGKPRVQSSPVDDALTEARTEFIKTQLGVQWLQAQARDMDARAQRALLEVEMWPKQFVTEDDERAHLRDLARAANKALVALTPEAFAAIVPGCTDPAASLEALKGLLSRDQAEIFEEVMSGGREVADSEEEEEE